MGIFLLDVVPLGFSSWILWWNWGNCFSCQMTVLVLFLSKNPPTEEDGLSDPAAVLNQPVRPFDLERVHVFRQKQFAAVLEVVEKRKGSRFSKVHLAAMEFNPSLTVFSRGL